MEGEGSHVAVHVWLDPSLRETGSRFLLCRRPRSQGRMGAQDSRAQKGTCSLGGPQLPALGLLNEQGANIHWLTAVAGRVAPTQHSCHCHSPTGHSRHYPA